MKKRESAQVRALKAELRSAARAHDAMQDELEKTHKRLIAVIDECGDWKRRFDTLLGKHCNRKTAISYTVSKG